MNLANMLNPRNQYALQVITSLTQVHLARLEYGQKEVDRLYQQRSSTLTIIPSPLTSCLSRSTKIGYQQFPKTQ
jgi:hypothetical protein